MNLSVATTQIPNQINQSIKVTMKFEASTFKRSDQQRSVKALMLQYIPMAL
jgi:hypothetical protein